MKILFLVFILIFSFNIHAQDSETYQQKRLEVFTRLCLQGMLKKTCSIDKLKCDQRIDYNYANETISYVKLCRRAMEKLEVQKQLSNEIAKIIPKYLNTVDIKND